MYSDEQKNQFASAWTARRPYLDEAKRRLDSALTSIRGKIDDDRRVVRIIRQWTCIKEYSSAISKADLKGLNSSDAVYEIGDLVRGRIVCANLEDVNRIRELILEELGSEVIVKTYDYIDKPLDSGYRALHLSLNLEVFINSNSFDFHHVLCELQIRTILQDSWAELVHYDIYKHGTELPADLLERSKDLAENLAAADTIAERISLSYSYLV